MSSPVEGAQEQSEERHSLKLTDKLLGVITSVVMGDAEKEDIIALFKGEGVERPNALVRAITHGRPSEAATRIVHRTPQIPFILNGTLYDPQDIQRFNGRALHFVPAANYEYMLAVDNADVMLQWWRLARLAAIEAYRYGGYRFGPGDRSQRPGDITPQSHPSAPEGKSFHFVVSVLFEHADFSGDYLNLYSGEDEVSGGPTHYSNLKDEGRGFLLLGDWNDVISSVRVEHGVTVLFEHAYYGVLDGGDSMNLFPGDHPLPPLGWNDRCSSVDTLGPL